MTTETNGLSPELREVLADTRRRIDEDTDDVVEAIDFLSVRLDLDPERLVEFLFGYHKRERLRLHALGRNRDAKGRFVGTAAVNAGLPPVDHLQRLQRLQRRALRWRVENRLNDARTVNLTEDDIEQLAGLLAEAA